MTYAQLLKEIKTFEDWGDDVYCNNKCRVMTVPKGTENWSNISKCRIALCRQTDRCTKGVSGLIERTKTICENPKNVIENLSADSVKTDSTAIASDSTSTDSTLVDIATQPEETSTDSI